MLLCCWLAAVGAGLLKSEEILEGVARLRLSNDIEFEEQNFIAMMNEAREVSRILLANEFLLLFIYVSQFSMRISTQRCGLVVNEME